MAISYSAQGAGEATGLSTSFIYEAVRSGELPGRYAKSKLIIEHDALAAWVASLPTDKPEVGR